MAYTAINPTQLTPPRVALIDSRTGAISREWYRFFLSLLTATEQTQNAADNIAPDTTSLLASYDAMLANLAQESQTTPDGSTINASLEAKVNDYAQSFSLTPRNELGTMAALQQADVPWLTFNNAPTPVPTSIGTVYWDGGTTLNIQATANVIMRVGEAEYVYVKASSAITKGQLCYHTGAVGGSGVITAAPTPLALVDPNQIVGVAAETIALNGFGLIQVSGTLRGFNTTGSSVGETWADGDPLYYNPAYIGSLTKVKPSAPNQKTFIGEVINAGSGSSGSISIRITPGSVLGGTDSNVQFGTLANNDLIQYDSALQYWKNVPASSISIGTATNLAGGAANRIAYQTAPNTTNFITAPTTANTFLEWSGSAFQWTANPLGTVTSVAASGGTTGLTFTGSPITTSGTLTLGGTLGVANGGTGATTLTSGYLLKGNGTSAVSASVAYDDGSAILIGTTTNKGRLTVSAASYSNAPVLGSVGGIVNFSNPDVAYGLLFGVNSADGHAWLQAQRTDGTATAHTITLNEAGGNVAIGKSTAATALDVNGTVTATSFTGAGTGLTGTASALSIGGNAATATTATSATTAGSVTNSVTFNNSGTGNASGTTFNGSAARTISYNTIGAQPAGTYVTSVTGTAPVVSSGGTTPAISMAAATGSVNGYLTSTDWTTFNGKQAALVSGTNIKTVNGTTLLGSGDLGTITAGYGGTGQSSYTIGDILYASGTTALSKLADVATGNALISGGVGVAPSWGKIGLTTHVSGTLPVANGGTGATTLTSGYLLKGNGTSAVSASIAYDSGSAFLVGTTTSLAGNTRSEFKENGAGTWPLTLNSVDRGLLCRQSSSTTGFYAYFEYNGGTNNGSISYSGGTTSYTTTSDARIKDNIIDAPDAGDLIDGIKVRSWDFKADGNHWRYGMVAQELLPVMPEAVSVPADDDMMMGVDYSKIVPPLIKEIQSLRRRVAMLENM